MVTRLAARKTIYDTFINAALTSNYKLDNEVFDPPEDNSSSWVRVIINFQDIGGARGGQITLGSIGNNNVTFRRWGRFFFQVYTPTDSGTKANDDLCDSIADLFEGKTLDNVTFWDTDVQTIGIFNDIWYQQNVTSRFWFDEIK